MTLPFKIPVPLSFSKFKSQSFNQKDPLKSSLLLLHGFLGSKKNFRSLAPALLSGMGCPAQAFVPDLRNHGDSPHALPMNYAALTADIGELTGQENLERLNIVGYSMGGKIAMRCVLDPTIGGKVRRAVIIDNSPVTEPLGEEFHRAVKCLKNCIGTRFVVTDDKANQDGHDVNRAQKKAESRMINYIAKNVSSKLMAYYYSDCLFYENGEIKSKVPLDAFNDEVLKEIGDWPTDHDRPNNTEILFLKAEKSNFINQRGIENIKKVFPNNTIITVKNATHEDILVKHRKFIEPLITDFLK